VEAGESSGQKEEQEKASEWQYTEKKAKRKEESCEPCNQPSVPYDSVSYVIRTNAGKLYTSASKGLSVTYVLCAVIIE
jgi:hypothetical protein